jgi:diketogulonate reductase-like aldo/keto reductase
MREWTLPPPHIFTGNEEQVGVALKESGLKRDEVWVTVSRLYYAEVQATLT